MSRGAKVGKGWAEAIEAEDKERAASEGRAKAGGGGEGRKVRKPEAKRKRRAGLEPEAEKGRERCMQEGDVRCALVYKELEGVGIVEESQAEESGWRRALCDKLWLKAGGQVWRRYDTEHDSAMAC